MLLVCTGFKLDHAVDEREERVVAADTDVVAGMNRGTSLTNENVAGKDELSVAALYSQTLSVGISAVLGRAAALFMCK